MGAPTDWGGGDTQVGAPTDWGGGTHRWVLPQTDEVGVWDTHGCVGHTGGCSHRLEWVSEVTYM